MMEQMIRLTIDGRQIEVAPGTTILEACEQIGIEIPTLCYMKELRPEGSCRMCLVEVKGARNLQTACTRTCDPDIEVTTMNDRVYKARRYMLDLTLSNHTGDCFSCPANGKCKLSQYSMDYGIEKTQFEGAHTGGTIDDTNEFYIFDPNKCILCRRCVRTCNNLQANSTIGIIERGFNSVVGLPFHGLLKNSNCVSCGNCVSVCPTGALSPKGAKAYREWEISRTRTTCSYCGVGCQMDLLTKKDKVVGVEPAYGPANHGLLCVKGKFAYHFVNHPARLTKPLIKKDGVFVEATWDEALELIVRKGKEALETFGPDAIGGLSSARVTNEDNYVFQKMMRTVFKTNNVDHCARLCHASTVAGLAISLGSGAMTNSIAEVIDADAVFVIGSNTTETHPVIGSFIRQARKNGAKIIVAEPREITLAKEADVFLQIKPGTNVALLNGMMNVIIEEGLADNNYIEARTENFEELKALIKEYIPEKVAEICGIDVDELREAARIYAKAEKCPLFYSMGVTQHSSGTNGVMSIANLALLCGKIGKEGSGVDPLRGQNNVQGSCDMGCLPGDYTGYQKTANEAARAKFSKAWGVEVPRNIGMTVTEMIPAAAEGKLHYLYIMGENPMISDPDIHHVEKALNTIDFLVVQDIFLTETAAFADVVLPATTFAEKDGTFTNTERRVQRVRKAIPAMGEAREDWAILSDIMSRMGYDNSFTSPKEIMDEIAELTPSYGGMHYERLEGDGLQWPCPNDEHPGTPILHTVAFTRGERAVFKPAPYEPAKEQTDEEYPFIFTTGRILYHYHTRTMTGKTEGLNNISGHSYVEINCNDAERLGIADGDQVKVRSRRGEITVEAKVVDSVEPGVLFMPFHFADGPANMLTNPVYDPIAKIPELKVCAVDILKV